MTLNGQAASVLDGEDREAGEKGVWLERSWGSSKLLRRAKGGSRQLVGVLRCSHGVEDVFLFIPMLFLSEGFGVPLFPEVTCALLGVWRPWGSDSLCGVCLNGCLLTSVVKVLERYSVLLSLPRDSYAYLVVYAKGVPSTRSTLSPEAACRCSVSIWSGTLCPVKRRGPRTVLKSGGTMLQ